MKRIARLLVLALCLNALPLAAFAQTPPAKPKKPATTTPAPRVELDPLAEARRNVAISLVNSLADEARSFRDPVLRARVQARAADVLWETDKARARALFRRAWEAAEAADTETARLTQEERRARAQARGSGAFSELPQVGPEVLRLASRRDRALGEEFLGKLDEMRKQEASNATSNQPPVEATPAARFDPDNPPPALLERLRLAEQLLADGQIENAIQFADPALYPINTFGMAFLDQLREWRASVANDRYAALIMRAMRDPASDANTVSLLSSYILTPHMYVTFGPSGDSHTRRRGPNNTPPADLPAQLRAAFFQAAAAILLRPLPPPEQDRTSTGRGGTYMVIARLAPVFEQYAPDAAPALRARLAILQPDTPERNRNPSNTVLTRGLVPEGTRDRVQENLDRLSNAQTSDERDEIYVNAFLASFREDNETRTRELADKIEDLDMRKRVRAMIAFHGIQKAITAKDADAALRAARSEELTPVQRTWGITEAARMMPKTDAGRAIETLESALVEARRIDAATPDRVRALVAIATQLFELDRSRAWETMSEVVKAANAAAEFSGEDGGLMARLELKGGGAMTTNFNVESFDLNGIFRSLAREDFDRAVSLAKSFNAESPRSVATLVAARTILDTQKPKTSREARTATQSDRQ
ncbi:MAG TPA: hypothetical protein VNA19_10325 [Pyrinomonadaceae bacterium]|jgi:hypothetical protein|nr:hypothetical protein [Pyrinomonadaceae bacterium]